MLLGYDCWNEPHLEPAWVCNYWGNLGDRLFCYCQETRAQFRRWLADKYATVQNLNATWGRAYGEWDDVNPPNRHGTYADWLDWGRFWYDQLAGHMRWRYEILKAVDPDHFVMSHSGAVPPFLPRPNAYIHNWKLAEPVDLWGTSFAPKYHNWDLSTCCGTIDATRSAARGQAVLDQRDERRLDVCAQVRRNPRCRAPRTIAHGTGCRPPAAPRRRSTGATWRKALDRRPRISVWCAPAARPPSALDAAAEVAGTLRRYAHIIDRHQPQESLGILYDPDNSMQLFAMEGEDELYARSHIGYYRAAWACDQHVRYVTYDTLDDLAGLRVLLAPMCLTLPEAAAARIAQFVREGGVLIAEARTGLFDQRGYNRPSAAGGAAG